MINLKLVALFSFAFFSYGEKTTPIIKLVGKDPHTNQRSPKKASPLLKLKIAGFNRVQIFSDQAGILYRSVSGRIKPEYGLTDEDTKGKLIADKVRFPYVDTVPVSLSEVTWHYQLRDEQGNVLASAQTDPDEWPEELLPQLVLPKHPEWVTLYRKAWELNWHRTVSSMALPSHFAYNATPDNNTSYVWDSCFNLMFQRYGAMAGAEPATVTLDDFYAMQAPSGYIARHFITSTFAPGYNTSKTIPTIDAVNPPLFAWAEWNYYLISADKKRLVAVLPKLIKQYEFIDAFLQEKPGKYVWNGNPSGWDNIMEVQQHKYWVELPAMQALSAQYIISIAKALDINDVQKRFKTELEQKRKVMNTYWNKDKSWYCSLNDAGGFTGKTLNGMWPVMADIVSPERLKHIVDDNLLDTGKFLTSAMPLPSLAKDEIGYDPQGKYWHGSVWINMSMLAISSLEQHGYPREAQNLAIKTLNGMYQVYKDWQPKPHTLWECYAPEFAAPASHKVRPGLGSVRTDFADWTCCLINLIIENVMGIQINAPDNTIIWSIRMDEEHGINNLQFGNLTTDLLKKDSTLLINANHPYLLQVTRNGKTYAFHVKAGSNKFEL